MDITERSHTSQWQKEGKHNKLDSIPQCQHWFTNLTQIKMTIYFLEQ